MIDADLLAKFKRRAPKISNQQHLDMAMSLFPVEHHDEIAAEIQPLLPVTDEPLIARKVEVVPEIKPKDPENPSLHETTVERLNSMAVIIEQLKAEQKPLRDHIADLQGEIEMHQKITASLISERDELKSQIENLKAQTQKNIPES